MVPFFLDWTPGKRMNNLFIKLLVAQTTRGRPVTKPEKMISVPGY